jgi:hypothetical protein
MVIKILPYGLFRVILTFFILAINLIVHGQAPTHVGKFDFIDNNINGFYQYLPRDFQTDVNVKYPLLIFLHGSGESGSTQDQATLDKLLVNGIPKLINQGNFPESVTVGGSSYRFIVLSPQIKNGLQVVGNVGTSIIQPSTIDAVIEYAKTAFPNRIDESRIYLAGLSMGGGAIWDFAGSSSTAANKLAAVVVAAGAGDLSDAEANTMAAAKLPVLATHNTVDNIVSVERTRTNIGKLLTYSPAMSPSPETLYFTNAGPGIDNKHNVWTRTFEELSPNPTSGGNVVDSLGVTTYHWLLQFARLTATPVKWESVTATGVSGKVNVEWTVSNEQRLKHYEVERSNDGSNWTRIATVQPSVGATGRKQYRYTDEQPVNGMNHYRVKQLDLDGKFTYSAVKTVEINKQSNALKVYPNPFSDNIDLYVSGVNGRKLDISIVAASGAVLRKESREAGINGAKISIMGLNSLAPGIYYVIAKDDRGSIIYNGRVWKNK